jgi:hypothetical protein
VTRSVRSVIDLWHLVPGAAFDTFGDDLPADFFAVGPLDDHELDVLNAIGEDVSRSSEPCAPAADRDAPCREARPAPTAADATRIGARVCSVNDGEDTAGGIPPARAGFEPAVDEQVAGVLGRRRCAG